MSREFRRRIKVEFRDDGGLARHRRELRASKKETQELVDLLRRLRRETRRFGSSTSRQTQGTTRAASEQKRAMRELRQVTAEARIEFDKLNLANRRGQITNQQFASSVATLRAKSLSEIQRIRAGLKEVPRDVQIQIGRSIVALERFATRAQEVVTGRTRLRTRISQAVSSTLLRFGGAGLGLAAFAGVSRLVRGAARGAIEFRDAMAEVSTLVDTTAVNMQQLEDGVLDIASRVPVDFSVLSPALYQVISAGITDTAEALNVLEVAARAAVGGNTDVKTAVDGITSALNAFGIEASKAEEVADAFFVAVKAGKTTFGELSANIGQVAPQAAQLGVSLEEVLAATAAITLTGVPTAQAMTQIAAVFTAAAKKADQFSAIGIDLKRTLGEKGLLPALKEVREKAEAAGVDLVKLFGRVEGTKATLTLTGPQYEKFGDILEEMGGKAGASAEAFSKMEKATGNLARAFSNKLQVFFTRLAETILPSLNRELERALSLLNEFSEPEENLLRTLRAAGVKGEELARIEEQLNRVRLRRQRRQIEEELKGLTAEVDLKIGDKDLLDRLRDFGSFAELSLKTPLESFRRFKELFEGIKTEGLTVSLAGLDQKELDKIRSGLVRDLRDISKELSPDNEAAREAINELILAIEDELSKVEQAIALNEQLRVIKDTLAESTRKQARAQENLNEAEEEGGDPPTFVPDDKDLAKAREMLRTLDEARRIMQADREVRSTLAEILKLDGEIADIEAAIAKVRGSDAETGLRRALAEKRARREGLEESIKAMERLRELVGDLEKVKILPAVFKAEDLETPAALAAKVKDVIADAESQIQGITVRVKLGIIDAGEAETRIEAVGQRAEAALKQIVADFARTLPPEALSAIDAFLKTFEKATGQGAKSAQKTANAFKQMATAGRALFRLVGILGDISDEVRAIGGGLFDVLDNLGRLNDLKEGASFFEKLPGIVGAIAGGLSIVSGLAGLIFDNSKEEALAQRMEELRQALADNARQISDAIDRLINEGIVGGPVSGAEISAAEAALAEFRRQQNLPPVGTPGVPAQFTGDPRTAFLSFLDQMQAILDQSGIEVDLRAVFLDLIAQGRSFEEAVDILLNQGIAGLDQGLLPFLDALGGPDGLSANVKGASEAFRLWTQFLGVDAMQAVRDFADFLRERVDDLSPAFADLLSEVSGLDLSTEEGRRRLDEIIKTIINAILTRDNAFLGGLSPEDAQQIADILKQGLTGGGAAVDSTAVQVQRAISDVKANDVVDGLDRIAFFTQSIYDLLRAWIGASRSQAFRSASRSVGAPVMSPGLAAAVNAVRSPSPMSGFARLSAPTAINMTVVDERDENLRRLLERFEEAAQAEGYRVFRK